MPKKILILDDEELIIRTLARLLEKSGYEVLVVKNGQDAVAMVEEDEIDLIISDIRMPGLNGLEAMKSVCQKQEQNGKKKIPLIFITGYADLHLEQEAKELKPVDYIYKPFDLSELMTKVKEALQN